MSKGMRTSLCCGMTICVLAGAGHLYGRRDGEKPIRHLVSNAVLHQAMASPRLAFEPNEGQTDKEVRFLSRGPGFQLFLTDTEAVFALARPTTDHADRSTLFNVGRRSSVSRPATI